MKIRLFFFDISINWIMIGTALLYGAALGVVVSTGKTKTITYLLIPTVIFIFRSFSERFKFGLLALSIPLSLVQIPTLPLPYSTSLSEAILLVLAFDDILFHHHEHKLNEKPFAPVMVILLGLFCLAGLVANMRISLYIWNTYCVTPLIMFYLISRKIHSWEDAWLFVKLSLLTIVGFIVIVELAVRTGNYIRYDPLNTEASGSYRMADGMIIALGPVRLTTFATRMGAIVALGLPTCVLLWMQNQGKIWWRTFLLLFILGFGYVLVLSATRGSVVAAGIGTLLVLLVSGRYRSPIFVGATVISLVILVLWGEIILTVLPAQNIQRIQTLLHGVQSIDNYQQRMNVLDLAWNLTLRNPLGVGFGYLYSTYRIDDAIIYAVILQGTGIFGAIVFIMMMGYLALQFGLAALKLPIGSPRDMASVGLSTLAAGLLAGISSQSILFEPVHAFVFWTLMAVCYYTVVRLPS